MSVKSTIKILLNLHLYNQDLQAPGSWTEFGDLKSLAESLYTYPQLDRDFREALQDFDNKDYIEVDLHRCRITPQGKNRAGMIFRALTQSQQSRTFETLVTIGFGIVIGLLIGIYVISPKNQPPTPTLVSNPLGVYQGVPGHPISVGCWIVAEINSTVRLTPGYTNKPSGDKCAWLGQGDTVQVIGGPQTKDGLTWWEVEVMSGNCVRNRGWVAEWNRDGKLMLRHLE